MQNLKREFVFIILSMFCFLPLSASATGLVLDWAKQLGGAANNYSTSIAVDSSDNSFNTGYFLGTVDCDPGVGVVPLTSAGGEDFFISKLDSNGDFAWVKQIGGAAGDDDAYDIVLDSSGNIYVAGYFTGAVDFNPGAGIFELTSIGSYDSFIVKLDSSGGFLWAKQTGTAGLSSLAHSIDFDSLGNVYVTGRFAGIADVFGVSLTSAGSNDIYVAKLEPDGDIVWAKKMGGAGSESGAVVSFDSLGYIYISGNFAGTADFDPGIGVVELTSVGGNDIYIVKLDLDGNFVWAKRMGGAGADGSYYSDGASLVDSLGSTYVTGYFTGTADFGGSSLTSVGGNDIFISKFNSDGDFVWTKQIGGIGADVVTSASVDSTGNVYIAGYFNGTVDFDTGAGTSELTSVPVNDNFILKLNSDGDFAWVEQKGGQGGTYFFIDEDGNNYFTGGFTGITDFGGTDLTSAGGNDVYVSKFFPEDTTPIAFSFTDQTNLNLSFVVESNTIIINGINSTTPISIISCTGVGCEYSINGGAYTSVAGTVENGDTVKIHQTSSGIKNTVTNLTLSIGGVTDVFSVTTIRPLRSSSGSYSSGHGPNNIVLAPTVPTTPPTDCQSGYLFSPSTGKSCGTSSPISPTDKFIFTKDLKYLMIDNEVKELQKFLNTHGYVVSTTGAGSLGNETTKFGALTKAAVIKFQLANKISPTLGYFGPVTRGVVNKLLIE